MYKSNLSNDSQRISKGFYGASSAAWNAVANAWNACGVGDPGGALVDAGVTVDSGLRSDATLNDARADAGPLDAATSVDGGAMRFAGTIPAGGVSYFATPSVAAGAYTVTMTGTGDADIYVKVGAVPTTTSYTCRPYLSSTNESCVVNVAAPNTVKIMVKGVAASSTFAIAVTKT